MGAKGRPAARWAERGLIIPRRCPPGPIQFCSSGPSGVAACETLGLASVGRPSNSSGGKFIAQLLARREVIVLGENDQNPAGTWPGREGAETLATHLATKWKRVVRWALPPEGHMDVRAYVQHLVASGLDLNDKQACHETGRRFLESLDAAASEEQPPASSSEGHTDDGGAREVVLHLCVEAGDHFFHDNENRAFVLVREGGVARTLSVKSREYGLLLGRRFYRATGSGLPSAAKTEAIATLEGLAIFDGPEEMVFVRSGEYEGKVVLDLCDEQWRVVVIGKEGWEVATESPIRFRRTRGMLALPAPVPGGSINDLRPFINVPTDNDFILVCAFILGCFNPRGPFIILLVNGEPGSAKSTLCRVLRALIDPNKAPLRSEPKDNRDLAIAANNAWMIGLDNMSYVSERISNALCRLATGGGFATRELYTDADETIFDAKRPVMINGIGEVADRSDLIDRAIRLTLPTIPEHQRRTERDVWCHSKNANLRSSAYCSTPSASHSGTKTRCGSPTAEDGGCACWVVAAEPACPWPPGSFIAALTISGAADEFVIEANPIASAIRDRVEQHGEIEGTATELLELLLADKDEKPQAPRLAQDGTGLGDEVAGVTPNLRRLGIEVQFHRARGRRTISIRRADKPRETLSLLSSLSQSPPDLAQEAPNGDSGRASCDSDLPFGDSDSVLSDSYPTLDHGNESPRGGPEWG